MPRIKPVERDTASAETGKLLESVEKKMGMVPNLIATMAQSPAVATAYLQFSQALGGGALPPRLREQISLTVGEANRCDYCVSAHATLGRRAGLQDEGVLAARQATAADAKENEALGFAKKVVDNRGNVNDGDLAKLREAGYSEGEICEIVAAVALNIFTNYFNHIAETEIDFPVEPALVSA